MSQKGKHESTKGRNHEIFFVFSCFRVSFVPTSPAASGLCFPCMAHPSHKRARSSARPEDLLAHRLEFEPIEKRGGRYARNAGVSRAINAADSCPLLQTTDQ